MYTPRYFSVSECVPPDLADEWGTSAWGVFDERILKAADMLRDIFGPIWINGKGFTQCGYRTNVPATSRSQHRFGRALDLHPTKVTPQDMRRELLSTYHQTKSLAQRLEITFIETDINWVHIDCRNSTAEQPILWSPKRGYLRDGEPIDL